VCNTGRAPSCASAAPIVIPHPIIALFVLSQNKIPAPGYSTHLFSLFRAEVSMSLHPGLLVPKYENAKLGDHGYGSGLGVFIFSPY